MTEEKVPRKWEYIADQLKELNAPLKVINAAIELDAIMCNLGLGHGSPYWLRHYAEYCITGELHELIFCQASCTACVDCRCVCSKCKLGVKGRCTPRSRYADDYFGIVGNWSTVHVK